MCYRPRHIKVRGVEYTVPCGKCMDCQNKKADRNAFLCKLEASRHKYVHFVTLTYDMESVPTARVYFEQNLRGQWSYSVRNISSRMSCDFENDLITFQQNISQEEADLIFKVFDECRFKYFKPYEFPYTTCKEAQRFIKRLRYYIAEHFGYSDGCEEKIRYYIASEYGPQSFRPHFHALIFHDSFELQSIMCDLVCKAWQFGNSTCELARGGCANYSAAYTSANSYIPPLHKVKPIAPKCLHSAGLGCEKVSVVAQGCDALLYERLNNRAFQDGNILKKISSSLSIQSSLFPRCISYAVLTHTERLNCFCFLLSCRKLFGDGFSLKEYARFYSESEKTFRYTENYHLAFLEKVRHENLKCCDYEKMLYGILCTSSLFLSDCKLFGLSPEQYLSSIELYYVHKEQCVLKQWYEEREKNQASDPLRVVFCYDDLSPEKASFKVLSETLDMSPMDLWSYWYNNRDDYKVNRSLAECWSKASIKNNKMLKHKELQDLNEIFNYKEKWQM